jgi:hypothetical protein
MTNLVLAPESRYSASWLIFHISQKKIGDVALLAYTFSAGGFDSRYRSAIAGVMRCSGCERKAEARCRVWERLRNRVRSLHVLWVRILLLRLPVD